MEKQARKRADDRSGLNIGEAIKPVEKALHRLADRTDKSGKSITGKQDIASCFLSGREER